jgi:hypothetical protein
MQSSDSSLPALNQMIAQTTSRLGSGLFTTSKKTKQYYGGDPRNGFHALRQYLLALGIDTRVFSFGSIALPAAIDPSPSTTDFTGTVDNSFFFEFHRILSPEANLKVNVLVLLVRVFFDKTQDSPVMYAQLVLNHHQDAVYELNDTYNTIIDIATTDGWAEPSNNAPSGRITFFEKSYKNFRDFQAFVKGLQKTLLEYEVFGNNLIPAEPAA